MRDHPSGKPIHRQRVVGKTVWRVPDKGPVTPRLQDDRSNTSAIGFTAKLTPDEPDSD